jgi:exodeoxyribonuclease VII large subunit
MFDPSHGLSLRIIDIDPAFSLGELEREKQETIEQLQNEGIFGKNKTLTLPLLPKRIAIISVQTSKGYADFIKVIGHNAWGYNFFHMLFPSLLQGERAVDSILYQLQQIRKVISHFDVVAIIRGGGGDVGLSSFNNFELSKAVALFPIPVITGIGHATNETVTEMVAFKNAITPTDLADYLLQKFHDFSFPLQKAEEKLIDKARKILKEEQLRLRHTTKYFRSVTHNILIRSYHTVKSYSRIMFQQSNALLLREKELHASIIYSIRSGALSYCNTVSYKLEQMVISVKKGMVASLKQKMQDLYNVEKSIDNMRPENVLKRGYTITLMNGRIVKSYGEVKENDIIQTILADGSIISETKSFKKSD